jgi:hypothetical protein
LGHRELGTTQCVIVSKAQCVVDCVEQNPNNSAHQTAEYQ